MALNLNTPYRSYDYETLDNVVAPYKHEWVGFNAQSLVQNPLNILVTDGNKNFGLFEYEEPLTYYGHYLFSVRGEDKTYKTAYKLLDFFFTNFPVETILGLTPVEHKGALRLNKKIGLKTYGLTDTEAGWHYEVKLTRKDFYNE